MPVGRVSRREGPENAARAESRAYGRVVSDVDVVIEDVMKHSRDYLSKKNVVDIVNLRAGRVIR